MKTHWMHLCISFVPNLSEWPCKQFTHPNNHCSQFLVKANFKKKTTKVKVQSQVSF